MPSVSFDLGLLAARLGIGLANASGGCQFDYQYSSQTGSKDLGDRIL